MKRSFPMLLYDLDLIFFGRTSISKHGARGGISHSAHSKVSTQFIQLTLDRHWLNACFPTTQPESDTRLDAKSRTSATSGNGVGISVRSAHTGKAPGSKSKPAMKTSDSLSDQDDNIKRAGGLQNPRKEMIQPSSSVCCS